MADDEIVVIVDENNQVTGSTTRKRMRAERLIHRATYIFVFSSSGQLYVQKRTDTKDMAPGYYDAAAGGVVLSGESYELSAEREAAEELGIRDTPLERCFDFYYEDERNRIWGCVFTCRYDGEFVWQPEEVEYGYFVDVDEVLNGSISPLTTDTLEALEILKARALIPGSASRIPFA